VDTLALTGGRVVHPSGIEQADVVVGDGRIVAIGTDVGAGSDRTIDLQGALLSPGFIDLQLNGGWGIDLSREPERIWNLAAHLVADGVTAFCPTLVSCPESVRTRFLELLRTGPPNDGVPRARSLGAHLEGPILNPVRRGAHPAKALRGPGDSNADTWNRPEVAYVTLAPELPDALDLVRSLVARGIRVAAGHTDATTAQILEAHAAGVGWLTHLFNAMAPFNHRAPGPIGAALGGSSTLCAGIIADGVHVDSVAVAMAWRALGPERLFLVTDSVSPMGLIARGETIRLSDGTLAGANLHMADALANFVAFTGCSVQEAVTAATATPARMVGATTIGRIEVGYDADFVVLTDEFEVLHTFVGGEVTYGSFVT
jgi:N-acetylglucosamine-6-phosphate deacetylase